MEYKTDHTAAHIGNAFIETISVDSEQKAGWAFTSQADLVLYYVPVCNHLLAHRIGNAVPEPPRTW